MREISAVSGMQQQIEYQFSEIISWQWKRKLKKFKKNWQQIAVKTDKVEF